jgi:hypothetical protein
VAVDSTKATFDALNTIYAGDVGAGGLADTTGTAYVRLFRRVGHADENSNLAWPRIEVDIQSIDARAFGSHAVADHTTSYHTDQQVTFYIVVKKDTGITDLDAVVGALTTAYDDVKPADSGGWAFSHGIFTRGPFRVADNGNEMRFAVQYRVRASK